LNIELDGIPLVWTEQDPGGGVTEIRNISNIDTIDKRSIVEHKIPGMEGSVFQDLGRFSVRISFDGSLQGKSAKSKIEVIRSKFKQGIPLPFNSDISGAMDITKVLIEDLHVENLAGSENRFRYSIVLKEYKEPPPEPITPPSQEEEAKKWSDNLAKDAISSINYLTGRALDSDGKPKEKLAVLVSSENGEFKAMTDKDGVYSLENLPPGKYTIRVDSEEYKGVEETIIIDGEGETPGD
jgi:hypothetical protein